MKKILIATILILASGIANAAGMQSTSIPLTGGVIQPKDTLKIDFKPLVAQAPYQVTCTISVPAAGVNVVEIMPQYRTQAPIIWSPSYSLNGNTFNTVGVLTQTDNAFVAQTIEKLSGPTSLNISNLDTSNQVTVSNCIANPVVGN